MDKLKNFYHSSKIKKIALYYIASQLNETEITELGKLFNELDKDKNGSLTIE